MTASSGGEYLHRREFTLPGDPNAIPPVVDAILAFLREINCHAEEEPAIALALQEALSNAVVHGCRKDPSKTVFCSAACDLNGALVIVIRDPGPGFDSTRVRDPLTTEGLADDHGRGIHLMRNLMDEVRFEDNGKQVTLKKF
jgi:serine/threonine-protein kinase RsbW